MREFINNGVLPFVQAPHLQMASARRDATNQHIEGSPSSPGHAGEDGARGMEEDHMDVSDDEPESAPTHNKRARSEPTWAALPNVDDKEETDQLEDEDHEDDGPLRPPQKRRRLPPPDVDEDEKPEVVCKPPPSDVAELISPVVSDAPIVSEADEVEYRLVPLVIPPGHVAISSQGSLRRGTALPRGLTDAVRKRYGLRPDYGGVSPFLGNDQQTVVSTCHDFPQHSGTVSEHPGSSRTTVTSAR
jgi:hypothetical protein